MRLPSLMLCSFACSTTTAVLAQNTIFRIDLVGIHWNGFSDTGTAADPARVALEPVVRDASVGHDLPSIPSPYSYHALGLFCKAEVKLNRMLPFPVMVRLGDVQRAEELDGKGPSPDGPLKEVLNGKRGSGHVPPPPFLEFSGSARDHQSR